MNMTFYYDPDSGYGKTYALILFELTLPFANDKADIEISLLNGKFKKNTGQLDYDCFKYDFMLDYLDLKKIRDLNINDAVKIKDMNGKSVKYIFGIYDNRYYGKIKKMFKYHNQKMKKFSSGEKILELQNNIYYSHGPPHGNYVIFRIKMKFSPDGSDELKIERESFILARAFVSTNINTDSIFYV